ncbi:MAG: hypothetical protein KKF54_00050, partial [Candidatus Omnitrophica bacterium]|nr:hypothetical protein [Candidatus Omnitrophota bacterium]
MKGEVYVYVNKEIFYIKRANGTRFEKCVSKDGRIEKADIIIPRYPVDLRYSYTRDIHTGNITISDYQRKLTFTSNLKLLEIDDVYGRRIQEIYHKGKFAGLRIIYPRGTTKEYWQCPWKKKKRSFFGHLVNARNYYKEWRKYQEYRRYWKRYEGKALSDIDINFFKERNFAAESASIEKTYLQDIAEQISIAVLTAADWRNQDIEKIIKKGGAQINAVEFDGQGKIISAQIVYPDASVGTYQNYKLTKYVLPSGEEYLCSYDKDGGLIVTQDETIQKAKQIKADITRILNGMNKQFSYADLTGQKESALVLTDSQYLTEEEKALELAKIEEKFNEVHLEQIQMVEIAITNILIDAKKTYAQLIQEKDELETQITDYLSNEEQSTYLSQVTSKHTTVTALRKEKAENIKTSIVSLLEEMTKDLKYGELLAKKESAETAAASSYLETEEQQTAQSQINQKFITIRVQQTAIIESAIELSLTDSAKTYAQLQEEKDYLDQRIKDYLPQDKQADYLTQVFDKHETVIAHRQQNADNVTASITQILDSMGKEQTYVDLTHKKESAQNLINSPYLETDVKTAQQKKITDRFDVVHAQQIEVVAEEITNRLNDAAKTYTQLYDEYSNLQIIINYLLSPSEKSAKHNEITQKFSDTHQLQITMIDTAVEEGLTDNTKTYTQILQEKEDLDEIVKTYLSEQEQPSRLTAIAVKYNELLESKQQTAEEIKNSITRTLEGINTGTTYTVLEQRITNLRTLVSDTPYLTAEEKTIEEEKITAKFESIHVARIQMVEAAITANLIDSTKPYAEIDQEKDELQTQIKTYLAANEQAGYLTRVSEKHTTVTTQRKQKSDEVKSSIDEILNAMTKDLSYSVLIDKKTEAQTLTASVYLETGEKQAEQTKITDKFNVVHARQITDVDTAITNGLNDDTVKYVSLLTEKENILNQIISFLAPEEKQARIDTIVTKFNATHQKQIDSVVVSIADKLNDAEKTYAEIAQQKSELETQIIDYLSNEEQPDYLARVTSKYNTVTASRQEQAQNIKTSIASLLEELTKGLKYGDLLAKKESADTLAVSPYLETEEQQTAQSQINQKFAAVCVEQTAIIESAIELSLTDSAKPYAQLEEEKQYLETRIKNYLPQGQQSSYLTQVSDKYKTVTAQRAQKAAEIKDTINQTLEGMTVILKHNELLDRKQTALTLAESFYLENSEKETETQKINNKYTSIYSDQIAEVETMIAGKLNKADIKYEEILQEKNDLEEQVTDYIAPDGQAEYLTRIADKFKTVKDAHQTLASNTIQTITNNIHLQLTADISTEELTQNKESLITQVNTASFLADTQSQLLLDKINRICQFLSAIPVINSPGETVRQNKVTLTWPGVADAVTYDIEVKAGTELILSETTSNTEYLIEDLTDTTTYSVRIRAKTETISGKWSNPLVFVTDFTSRKEFIDGSYTEYFIDEESSSTHYIQYYSTGDFKYFDTDDTLVYEYIAQTHDLINHLDEAPRENVPTMSLTTVEGVTLHYKNETLLWTQTSEGTRIKHIELDDEGNLDTGVIQDDKNTVSVIIKGDLIQVKTPQGVIKRYKNNRLDTEQVQEELIEYSYEEDADKNIIKTSVISDAKTLEYDSSHRLEKISHSDSGSIEFDEGLLIKLRTSDGRIYEYNKFSLGFFY